ncbi:MAG: hypothetical protein ACRCXY_03465 [Fusobacteriaceae bacterium]
MGRTETASSKELERSMNMQVRVTTVEEHLSYMATVDKLDDKRRDDLRGHIIWHNSVQTGFFKRIETTIKDNNFSDELKTIFDEMLSFHKVFHKKLLENFEKEDYFEMCDDKTRIFLIDYIRCCREKLGNESRGIEEKLILENALKAISKK